MLVVFVKDDELPRVIYTQPTLLLNYVHEVITLRLGLQDHFV